MQVDAFAIRLRARSPWEAADLGVRLCQREWRSVYRCYWVVALPVFALCLATFEIANWLPGILIWWLKPWLDRTILFVLSRAGFGQGTRIRDLWRARGLVFWRQLLLTLTLRRLSFRRAFTQPVYQLEGLPRAERRQRLQLMRRRGGGIATLLTGGFALIETMITVGLLSLLLWFAPPGSDIGLASLFDDARVPWLEFSFAVSYLLVVAVLEPFYVASGFGLYLNRRVELEAWDIEQEFRRAFAN